MCKMIYQKPLKKDSVSQSPPLNELKKSVFGSLLLPKLILLQVFLLTAEGWEVYSFCRNFGNTYKEDLETQ